MKSLSEVAARGLTLGALALCLLSGNPARATLGGYYGVAGNPERWVDITDVANGLNTTVLYPKGTAGPDTSQTVSLPFTGGFPYNGATYSTLTVASNGFASFENRIGNTSCNNGACFPATTILAPWWGGLGVCYGNASVAWTTTSVASDFEVIVQWTNLSYDHYGRNDCSDTDIGKDLFNVQMRLHESGVIDFVYGDHFSASGTVNCNNGNGDQSLWCQPTDFPPPPCNGFFCGFGTPNSCLFAAGIEDDNGATPAGQIALECGVSCAHNLFPLSGTVNRFTSGPDLQLGVVDLLGTFSSGLATTITVEVANVASNSAASKSSGAETIDLYLSPVAKGSQAMTFLGNTSPLPVLAPGAPPITTHTSLTLPALPSGQVYIIAMLREPSGTPDVDPLGKTAASGPIVVSAPLPDLVAGPLNSAGSGTPGDSILMVPSVSNAGNAASPAGVPYAYYM